MIFVFKKIITDKIRNHVATWLELDLLRCETLLALERCDVFFSDQFWGAV